MLIFRDIVKFMLELNYVVYGDFHIIFSFIFKNWWILNSKSQPVSLNRFTLLVILNNSVNFLTFEHTLHNFFVLLTEIEGNRSIVLLHIIISDFVYWPLALHIFVIVQFHLTWLFVHHFIASLLGMNPDYLTIFFENLSP